MTDTATDMTLLRQLRATPNLLTLLRLFVIPYLLIEILDHRYGLALALFLLAGFSDAIDGRIARAFHQSTRLGQYLDPIADKLLLSTSFIAVTHVGLVPRYVTVLVLSRDFGILLISSLLYMTHTLRDFRPSLLGKLNTLAQIVTVVGVLWYQVDPRRWVNFTLWHLMIAIAWLASLSAAQYAWTTTRRIQHGPGESQAAK